MVASLDLNRFGALGSIKIDMVLLDVLQLKMQLVGQTMLKGRVKPRAKATAKTERIGELENNVILNHFQNFENALRHPPPLVFGNFR